MGGFVLLSTPLITIHTLLGWAGSVPGGTAVMAAITHPGAFMPVRALARSRCSTFVPLKGLILRADMEEERRDDDNDDDTDDWLCS